MKILSVRFKNLNSLLGEWKIDFSVPEYESLFAITGPTGAGKSTILDAICLGLYGQTPRLNKVTKNSNEIMSRLSGECFSEVEFSTHKGQFRCRWEQHRARRQSQGELQTPRHEICNALTGEIFHTKSRDVLKTIEEVTGMDFTRFTRSMLLAQGDFSAFLQASSDERSPILEQITGTEIYSSISQKVFEIAKNKEHELRLAEAALGELKPLTYQEEKNLIEKLNGEIQTRDEQEKVYEKKQQDLRLLQKREEYREKLKEVLRRKELVFQELSNFSPWQERLERALKAHEITPLFESIQQSRYEFKSRQVDLSNDRDRLKTQKEQLLTLMTQEEQYKKSVKQIQDNMKSLNTLFDRVIALDIELAQNNDRLQRIQRERSQREEELEQSEQALVENQGKFQEQMKAISLLEQYQSAYGADSRLSEDLYEMMAKFEAFKNEKESIESLKIKSEQLCRVRQKQQTLLDRERLCLAKLVEELQQKEQELSQQDEVLKIHLNGKLLREYETEEKALYKERELLLVIASLQSHRRALREGAPCPLCGATHHPYASENFPAPSELDQKIEALQSKIVSIRNAQETLETLRKSYTKKEKEFEEVKLQNKVHQTVLEQTLNQLKEVETAIENKGDELHETQSTLIEMIKVYEIDLAEVPSLEQALQKLKHRLDFWQQNQQQLILGRQNLQSLLIEKQRLQALMSTLQKQINTLIEQEIQQEGDYQLRQQTRKNLFQNKDPKVEREALHNKLLDCQNTLSQLREQRTSLAIENSQLEGIIQTNQQVLNEIKDQLRADEQGLTEQFQRLGFINQTDYLEALLPGQECDRLLQKRQSLEERVDDLNSQEKLLRNELSEAQKWIIEECTISEVEAKIREQRKILDELIGQISEKEFRLRENQRVKQELNDRVLNLQKLNEDCHHWGVLKELIGSSDGKKFRNFAQGLTLDVVITYANEHLQRMSDRYLLVRGQEEALQLKVLDNYQAGEIRSTKNLSGGEGFIVSLALALGLSSMASENVCVDSLFLDEGFGTLDDNALDTALQTLSRLRESGKLIGVISHVQALKDKIYTQIEVIPKSGGHSLLKGPGCQKIS